MKTANILICIAIIGTMTTPAIFAADRNPWIADTERVWIDFIPDEVSQETSTGQTNESALDNSLLLLYSCIDDYGEGWELWYFWEYDCAFWVCADDVYYIYCGTDNDNIYNITEFVPSIVAG